MSHRLIALPAHRQRAALLVRSSLRAFLLACLFLGAPLAARAETISKEYQLKAAFLYNFSKFVQWPAHRFADERSPIVIAVLGKNPFGDELEKAVQDRSVNGRPIAIRHIASAADIPSAHIVFVAPDAEPSLAASIYGDPAVLTVGETEAFGARGGIVNFTVVDEKVRFEINQGSAEKAGLKISGQLLKLATVVRKAP